MDPTTTLVPQDGRMTLVVDGRDYALRLSTLPVSGGERLVIRDAFARSIVPYHGG